MTANHITCDACHRPARRGEAVIRGDLRQQRGWHSACFTVTRATQDIDPAAVIRDARIGMSLAQRLEAARVA